MEKKNVGIWIRVSTEDQKSGESPQVHEHRARMYAEIKGWTVVEVYDLAGVSGKSVLGHPEAKRMMTDISSGKIKGLIFSKLARLARNTTELLQIAEYFKKKNADLISIQENIDTSSPAGRLLYTMIAALAEWEREEIASRVKESVKVRAKMGKQLGGASPFGYTWVDKILQLNLDEAPIRRKMFELFEECKKVKVVTRMINEMGYRTRRGKVFNPNTVRRYLQDPIAKGLHRVNYSQVNNGEKTLKPEEDWEYIKVPSIISVELWDKCQKIFSDTYSKTKRSKTVVQIFSGFMACKNCNEKMYVQHGKRDKRKYNCKKCKNKIDTDIAEMIFKEYLQEFLYNEKELSGHLKKYEQDIVNDELQIRLLKSKLEELNNKLSNIMELYQDGQIQKKHFSKHYNPLYEQAENIEISITRLEAEISVKREQLLSSDKVIEDARNLQNLWDTLELQERRKIVENVLQAFIVGKETAEIIFNYLPISQTTHPSSNPWEKGTEPLAI